LLNQPLNDITQPIVAQNATKPKTWLVDTFKQWCNGVLCLGSHKDVHQPTLSSK
jgi:hypothetical protein